MSLTTALRTAASGLNAAQAQIRATSDNIANVNTKGYVRKAVVQSPAVVDGAGAGVRIDGVKRVTDQYLQLASLSAGSDAERWGAVSQYLDNAQSLFGNPSKEGFFFNRLDKILGGFATAADDPSSSLLRSQALSSAQDFLSEADRINSQLVSLTSTVDTQVSAGIERANNLLEQITKLNADIRRSSLIGADASGSENIQSQLLDELSGLMNVRMVPREGGGMDVRSQEGVLLAGDEAAQLTYVSSATTPGYVAAKLAGSAAPAPIKVSSGEIKGLLELRDVELPKIYDQLGEYVSRAVDQLNAANNDATAFPPPTSMTGKQTGQTLPDAVANFTGVSTLAVVNQQGVLQRKIDIDFTNGMISVDGGAGAPFTPANFQAQLNTALTGVGNVQFTDGVMTLNATGGNGLALDEGTSQKAGKGFSHFFGLNDLIKSEGQTNYATGLTGTSAHGFNTGGTINLRLSDGDGRPLRDVSVAIPAGGSMNDLLSELNNTTSGVGLFGSFSLDSSGGLSFTGSSPSDAKLSVINDSTERTVGRASLSQFFGLGVTERSSRAGRFEMNSVLTSDPTKMSMGQLDTSVAVGQVAIRAGDGRGALAMSVADDKPIDFQPAGALGKVTMTLSRYGAEFGGSVGRAAASAETRKISAEAVAKEATNRRQSVEGVNIDEELVNLTTYQQAFNASARLIQATSDLFDTLLNIV